MIYKQNRKTPNLYIITHHHPSSYHHPIVISDPLIYAFLFFSVKKAILLLVLSVYKRIDYAGLQVFFVLDNNNTSTTRKSAMMKKKATETIFTELKSSSEPTVVESMCMNCHQNGTTILMFTIIPFFREIIISSFSCELCGFRNNEVQFGGTLPDFGVQLLFRVLSKSDMNRQIIKSGQAVIHFKQIDLEIPVNGKSEISTIQGFLLRTHDELKFHQALRKIHEPDNYEKLQIFLANVKQYIDGQKFPLTVTIRDPSGNSNIKNPYAPKQDKNMEISHFERSLEELISMGYSAENAKQEKEAIEQRKMGKKLNFTKSFEESNFLTYEPVIFAVLCSSCQMMGETRMCQTSIPFFTDLIIMSFSCDYCGAHSTETKNSGEIRQTASVLTLRVESEQDLKRDLFKSETCSVDLPEIELELQYGTLGGVFTTIEGLIEKIQDHFQVSSPFGDSDMEMSNKMDELRQKLKSMREGEMKFTMVLVDPLAHSFISNPYHPNPDPNLTIEFRPRTFDENEDLGLNDIKTQNYQTSASSVIATVGEKLPQAKQQGELP